eukprot:scaffold17988_cov136-Isochrysis_galbana.AAC.5
MGLALAWPLGMESSFSLANIVPSMYCETARGWGRGVGYEPRGERGCMWRVRGTGCGGWKGSRGSREALGDGAMRAGAWTPCRDNPWAFLARPAQPRWRQETSCWTPTSATACHGLGWA